MNDDVLSYRNLAEAEIYGVEIEATWFINDYLEHQFSFQQQNGNGNDQQRLDDLLPKKLNWNLLVNFDNWLVSNSVAYYFTADEVGASEAPRAKYALWDLSLKYQLSSTLSVSLILNNISNQNYYASLDEDAPLQPKRNIKLATTWHF